jgi:hypothetical protein
METRKFLKSDRWEEWKKYETDQRKGVPPPPPQKSYPEGATLIDLVAPGDLTIGQMPVIEAIRRRRSRREFTEEPLTLEELSFLLWATQGIDEQATQAFGHGQEEFAIYVAPVGKVTPAEYHFDH